MNHTNTGRTVTCTLDADTPRSDELIIELKALKSRSIDFSDIPEIPHDAAFIRTPPGTILGLMVAQARKRALAAA